MKLFYLPLEAYPERYTWYMSCKHGWAEDNFKKFNIKFERIEGDILSKTIKAGVVLDAYGHSYYAMSQLNNLIKKIRAGEVKDGDRIYTEDFWHPGIESLFYIRHLTGIDFKVGCFFHAQSVDESDFTFPMRHWIRDIERGLVKGYDYIFVCSPILKQLCHEFGLRKEPDNIHVIGLPYNSKRLLNQLKEDYHFKLTKKGNYVIFSSRFDKEKNPHFFMDLVEACPDIEFRLVKPRAKITNDSKIEKRLKHLLKRASNFKVVDTSNKLEYYRLLSGAKVQFNCAYQDWVSWTLLEAITFKCNPLYPRWKDFPFELKGFSNSLYEMNNLSQAKKKLYSLLEKPFDEKLSKIVKKHDKSWRRYCQTMELI